MQTHVRVHLAAHTAIRLFLLYNQFYHFIENDSEKSWIPNRILNVLNYFERLLYIIFLFIYSKKRISKVWKYDLLSLLSEMRCKKEIEEKSIETSQQNPLDEEWALGVSTRKQWIEERTLRKQCVKCWIVSVKWMNVLLLLILLFYSNRLCILLCDV